MTKPKLLLFAPSAFPVGGVPTWLDYLLPGLKACGWEVELALTQGRFHNAAAYLEAHPFENVRFVCCGTGTRAGRICNIAKAIVAAKPDLTIFVNLPDVVLAVESLRRRGVACGQLVNVVHGLERPGFGDLARLKNAIDAVVGVNRLSCAIAQNYAGIEPDRVFYAPCGASTCDPPAPSPACPALMRLAFIGRLENQQKRVLDLAALADELDRRHLDFHLLIAGAGPDESAVKASFRASLRTRVEFLGALPQAQIGARVLAKSDALVIASAWETGPIVAFEAMAAGVAVISSRFLGSGLERALIDGLNALLFPVGDMKTAADCVERLRDGMLREAIVQRARDVVRQRYSQAASVARWSDVLQQILGLPTRERARKPTLDSTLLMRAGRLDRWLGYTRSDLLRAALGRRAAHSEPGGEWPHTLSESDVASESFGRLATVLDAGDL